MRAWKFESALEAEGFIYDEYLGVYFYNDEEFEYKEALDEIAINENLCIAFSEEMFIDSSDYDFGSAGWEEDMCFDSHELEEIYNRYC